MSKKVIYTAKTHAKGGREGSARSHDGRLDVKLTRPGAPGEGTNPEQLFAAGWSACFISAMEVVAKARDIEMPADRAANSEELAQANDLATALVCTLVRARLIIGASVATYACVSSGSGRPVDR